MDYPNFGVRGRRGEGGGGGGGLDVPGRLTLGWGSAGISRWSRGRLCSPGAEFPVGSACPGGLAPRLLPWLLLAGPQQPLGHIRCVIGRAHTQLPILLHCITFVLIHDKAELR